MNRSRICLLAPYLKKLLTDLNEICIPSVWSREKMINFWRWFGSGSILQHEYESKTTGWIFILKKMCILVLHKGTNVHIGPSLSFYNTSFSHTCRTKLKLLKRFQKAAFVTLWRLSVSLPFGQSIIQCPASPVPPHSLSRIPPSSPSPHMSFTFGLTKQFFYCDIMIHYLEPFTPCHHL